MRTASYKSAPWLLGVASLVLAAGELTGCNYVTGVDGKNFESNETGIGGESAGPAGSGGSPNSGGTGGTELPPECTVAAECDAPSNTCLIATCLDQTCGETSAPAETNCGDDSVCDGVGNCVSPDCLDQVLNGDETDVDGGGDCGPCNIGDNCEVGTDCSSGLCETGVCACVDDVDCGSDQYCNAGSCMDQLDNGATCGKSNACKSEFCTDGVCCDTACEGTCSACDLAGTVGSCTAVATGTDPDLECGPGYCGGGASCVYSSCLELLQAEPLTPSGVYTIDPDGAGAGASFDAYCEMSADGGGWTLLMKLDGNNATFSYQAALWTDDTTLNPNSPDLDLTEAKLLGFSAMAVTDMRVGMEVAGTSRWLVIPSSASDVLPAASLKAIFETNTYAPTTLGRAAWASLLPATALQPNCNQEGFNAAAGVDSSARIGLLGNEWMDCYNPDSRIGLGTSGSGCGSDDSNSCGNEAQCNGTMTASTKAFGYVMVR